MRKLLNKYTVTELSKLSNLSKSYISQVKSGRRPPSKKLLECLKRIEDSKKPSTDYYKLFIKSRQAMAVSQNTIEFYKYTLGRFISDENYLKVKKKDVEAFLNRIPPNHNGFATRHASFRALKTFYRWLNINYGYPNPMAQISAPILGKPILPSLSVEQVNYLIEKAACLRDKAIIALFVESGLRLSELASIKLKNIDWQSHTIQIIGKGRKEALSPFGSLSGGLLRQYIEEDKPEDNLWNLNQYGIVTMLRRLGQETGIKSNPHTFRRTFACLLRKAGVDTMTIKDLGRWESLTMVQRYTRSVNFQDSLKFYKAPLAG